MADTKKPAFQVTNVKPRMISIAGIDIPPGETTGEKTKAGTELSHIPEKHVEGVKKSAPFRAGWLVEGKQNVVSAPIQIEKMPVEQAKKLISVETSIAVLSAWADADKRPEIISAITERTKAL